MRNTQCWIKILVVLTALAPALSFACDSKKGQVGSVTDTKPDEVEVPPPAPEAPTEGTVAK